MCRGSSRSGGAPSQMASTFVDQFLPTGILEQHIRTELGPAYSARFNRMKAAIVDHLLPLGFKAPGTEQMVVGGFFIWLEIPSLLLADDLAKRALTEEKLVIGSGTLFQVQGDCTENHQTFDKNIRLCFAWERFEVLYEGVKRLADVARRMIDEASVEIQ